MSHTILKTPALAWWLIGIGIALRILYATVSVPVSDAYLNLMTAASIRDCWCIPTTDTYGTWNLYRPPAGVGWFSIFYPVPLMGSILAGIMLTFFTYIISRHLGQSEHDSLFAAGITSILPIAVSLSSTANADIFTGAYLAAALLFLLQGKPLLTGAFAGFGALAKYDAFVFAPVPVIAFVWLKQWKKLCLYLLMLALVISPWMIHMWTVFGNPFYPYFEPQFGHHATPTVGHRQPLLHYLLGLPLSLFGVPEGSHYTVSTIALQSGISPVLYWIAMAVLFLLSILLLSGVWKLLTRSEKNNTVALTSLAIMYGFFFAIRVFIPIGSDVLDLRYVLVGIPLLSVGILFLPRKAQWALILSFLLASAGLYLRFSLAQESFAPYADGLEKIKTLPNNAVILTDADTTVYAHGITYHTGRVAFPYTENPSNLDVHVPFLVKNYSEIISRGPAYLWTLNKTIPCPSGEVYSNELIRICRL